MTERKSFKQELERLEAIVRQLENSDIDLDQAIELFEQGVGHLKTARRLLTESELEVKKVLDASEESIRTTDLEG